MRRDDDGSDGEPGQSANDGPRAASVAPHDRGRECCAFGRESVARRPRRSGCGAPPVEVLETELAREAVVLKGEERMANQQ
jgi:hypothetical protein